MSNLYVITVWYTSLFSYEKYVQCSPNSPKNSFTHFKDQMSKGVVKTQDLWVIYVITVTYTNLFSYESYV